MAQYDITSTEQTSLDTIVDDYSVAAEDTDGLQANDEQEYTNPDFTINYGYYKKIPELKKAIDAYATWVLGKGFESAQKIELEIIDGRGDEDFLDILWNMIVISKVNGDAYAEVIRSPNSGKVINIKPLRPSNIKIVYNKKGRIKRYEQLMPLYLQHLALVYPL